jgi:hypothetical protein
MPALEESGSVTVTTWALDSIADLREMQDAMFVLGLVATVWRHPDAPAHLQGRIQIDLPSQPDTPILVDHFGSRIKVISFENTFLSWERLPDAEGVGE